MPPKKIMNDEQKQKIYQELMQAIINKQKDILGVQVASERAQKVEELWVSADGSILQIKGGFEKALQSLINEYFKLTTQAGLDACVTVIEEFTRKHDGLKLPEEVRILIVNQSS